MKAYFSGKDATLCLEPENEDEHSMLRMWHLINIGDQTLYAEMVGDDCFAGFCIRGITDPEAE